MSLLEQSSWLSKYATNYHAWQYGSLGGKTIYRRPIGLVESSFDADGTDFGGRADMNALLTLEIRHSLSKEELRHRIALAWANLGLHHVLLQSRVHQNQESGRREFVVDIHNGIEDLLDQALQSIVWVEDAYPDLDEAELYRHCLNVGRIIDPSKCLSRLHVLPLQNASEGNFTLRFLVIMAHQISDGLSSYNWFSHFIRILNLSTSSIKQDIIVSQTPDNISTRLPPAQEDLYPSVAGNKARERWFWAILRVLRFIRKGIPPSIENPLRREKRFKEAISFPPRFDKIFDYAEERKPPMNSGHISVSLSREASARLIEICRSIKVSIGAGCFALAGISMMEIHEKRYPEIHDSERLPFAASFPLNPRAFFGFTTAADSCMLAFSDGIIMPFLASSLPIEGRFRFLAKRANQELRMYQKRSKSVGGNASLEAHSPGRLLANGYLYAIERVEDKVAPHLKTGINPQGNYKPKATFGSATCGVSSVGSLAGFFKPNVYDFYAEGKDLVADYRSLKIGVRARDNEFLIGSSTDHNGIVSFGVSYDGNAISEGAANTWAQKIASLLELERRPKL